MTGKCPFSTLPKHPSFPARNLDAETEEEEDEEVDDVIPPPSYLKKGMILGCLDDQGMKHGSYRQFVSVCEYLCSTNRGNSNKSAVLNLSCQEAFLHIPIEGTTHLELMGPCFGLAFSSPFHRLLGAWVS